MLTDASCIAAFFLAFFYKIKEISCVEIGQLIVPDLVTACNVNIVFACHSTHIASGNRLAVAHVLPE